MLRNKLSPRKVVGQVPMKTRRAFTLIELLTVIAITAILMTIIVVPMVQSFNLTRAAQAFSDAQDKARTLIEKIQREVNNAANIRDNSGLAGSVAVVVPNQPTPGNYGQDIVVTLPYQKLDIVRPAEGEPGATPGEFRNPYIGNKIDPTLQSPKGQTVLPVSTGFTIVRYFVGLRQPFEFDGTNYRALRYNNPYDGLLMVRGGGRDNLYVLYRAEVQPRVWQGPAATGSYVANADLFEVDAQGNPVLDDPSFFTLLPGTDYDVNTRVLTAAGNAKRLRIAQWQKRSVVQTEMYRYDMVSATYRKSDRLVYHDLRTDVSDVVGTPEKLRPRLLPTIQLKPSRVNGEMAEGLMAVRLGEETDYAGEVGPDVWRTQMGAWSGTTVRFYPAGWNRNAPAFDDYLVMRLDPSDGHVKVFAYDPGSGTSDNSGGVAIFDVTEYNRVTSNPQATDIGPFNAAVLPGAAGLRDIFVAMLPDSAQGKVTSSFGIDTVRASTLGSPLPGGAAMNQPVADTGPAVTPLNDPSATAPWAGATTINERFNRTWSDPAYAGLKPDKLHRFIDLRVTNQLDGSVSPLHPTAGFGRGRIATGSEVVIGPDQNPGPNYGQPIRYTRTTRTPGVNQYKINYVDQLEPIDYSFYGLATPPAAYDANNFVSAIFQPRFKAGYVQLNSDPNVPLPVGNIRVYYRFQFSGGRSAGSSSGIDASQISARQDSVAVDYDTRQLMSILLTIRNYPQANIPNPQSVTLTATAKVRNYLR